VCGRACASSNGTQFTCVTGKKVQTLTLLRRTEAADALSSALTGTVLFLLLRIFCFVAL
jgi:hypothetical protein